MIVDEELRLHFLADPVLRATCAPVTEVDEGIRQLAREMLAALPRWNGCGLAAPQVGRSLRLFVLDVGGERAFVNPRIVSTSLERTQRVEGCLSLPGVQSLVSRPSFVTVEATGLDGNPFTIEARGFKATAIQHEIDHLDGVLMIDPH